MQPAVPIWCALATLLWIASVAFAGACPSGRWSVAGVPLLGRGGADADVVELSDGMLTLAGKCPLASATVVPAGTVTRVEASWSQCGSWPTTVQLSARLSGADCHTLAGTLTTTVGGRRVTQRLRGRRIEPAALPLIPRPVEAWSFTNAEPLPLDARTRVAVDADRPDLLEAVQPVLALLRRHELALADVKPLGRRPPRHAIAVTTRGADPALGAEGYTWRIDGRTAVLRAPAVGGIRHGLQTLRQLLPEDLEQPAAVPGRTQALPAVQIRDVPRFAWRGFMLDVSRTFFPLPVLLRWVDLLALHKVNVFHLHLTDDQGWRIESAAFPQLHQVGSRWDPVLAPGETGGYYTARELRELVAYAAVRGVEIVPEIDVPSHAVAMLHAMPELACRAPGDPPRTGTDFPVIPWTTPLPPGRQGDEMLCVCDPRALAVLGTLLDELVAVFPSPWVHVGSDEVHTTEWAASDACPEVLAREGLSGVHELQAWFAVQLESMLRARGKRLLAWDELHAAQGPAPAMLSADAAVMHWRNGYQPPGLFDRAVVQADEAALFFDLFWVPLERTYAYDPVPAGLDPAGAARILGPHAAMWTHLARTVGAVDALVFPRLLALAETGWTPAARKDWQDFSGRVVQHRLRLDRLGVSR